MCVLFDKFQYNRESEKKDIDTTEPDGGLDPDLVAKLGKYLLQQLLDLLFKSLEDSRSPLSFHSFHCFHLTLSVNS